MLNNSLFKQNVNSVIINESSQLRNKNTLQVIVEDTTQLLRVDNHNSIHISLVTWSIVKNTTGNAVKNTAGEYDITPSLSDIIVDFYPNPVSENINIEFQGVIIGTIKLEIYDLQGKKIKISRLQRDIVNSINLNNLSQGIYLARIYIDNTLITTRKIIKN